MYVCNLLTTKSLKMNEGYFSANCDGSNQVLLGALVIQENVCRTSIKHRPNIKEKLRKSSIRYICLTMK